MIIYSPSTYCCWYYYVQPIKDKVAFISTATYLYTHWVPQLSDLVPPQWGLTTFFMSHKTRSARDRSIPRSLQRWGSTKSSISQLTFLFFKYYIVYHNNRPRVLLNIVHITTCFSSRELFILTMNVWNPYRNFYSTKDTINNAEKNNIYRQECVFSFLPRASLEKNGEWNIWIIIIVLAKIRFFLFNCLPLMKVNCLPAKYLVFLR